MEPSLGRRVVIFDPHEDKEWFDFFKKSIEIEEILVRRLILIPKGESGRHADEEYKQQQIKQLKKYIPELLEMKSEDISFETDSEFRKSNLSVMNLNKTFVKGDYNQVYVKPKCVMVVQSILRKGQIVDIYAGHVWFWTNLQFPDLCSMIGIRSSVKAVILKNDPQYKGIAYNLLYAVSQYGLSLGKKTLCIIEPLEPMTSILKRNGFKNIETSDGSDLAVYLDSFRKSSDVTDFVEYIYYKNLDQINLPAVKIVIPISNPKKKVVIFDPLIHVDWS